MIKIIRTTPDEENPALLWARLATLNDDRAAVVLVISAETTDMAQYVADNDAALTAQILADGTVDDRLTAKLRARDAKRLLGQSRLEGKTLEQVEDFIDAQFTPQTAKAIVKEMAGQVWMLYQVVSLIVDE